MFSIRRSLLPSPRKSPVPTMLYCDGARAVGKVKATWPFTTSPIPTSPAELPVFSITKSLWAWPRKLLRGWHDRLRAEDEILAVARARRDVVRSNLTTTCSPGVVGTAPRSIASLEKKVFAAATVLKLWLTLVTPPTVTVNSRLLKPDPDV